MASDLQRHEQLMPQPALDESYWSALLKDDEYSRTDRDHDQKRSGDMDHALKDHPYFDDGHPGGSDWQEIQNISDSDQVLELSVIGHNRGGLLVEWRSLRGFVPASQLVETPSPTVSGAVNGIRRRSLVNMVGQKLQLRVIELNPDKNRLILSERAAQARPGERADILHRLHPGDTVTGSITNLCDFGAFVDLGGLEGLIHISELSWGRVGHPEHMLERGQEITAYVLEVDRENARIALSLKRLRADPWKTVEQRYHIGEIVEGTITNVVDFGAFACIEEGLEGLIHVSELAEGHFLHPRNVVMEGQTIRARILTIDGLARRLGLSLRTNS
ncbi:MAG TPA: S1 RNA-binding domain-containing protein [Phototrophicaceae bacterium]|jgi:small subunit ribosomal protein S1|nr:S1 RNA-binding domain-containing protein [Phototrophicaceae bacterium]